MNLAKKASKQTGIDIEDVLPDHLDSPTHRKEAARSQWPLLLGLCAVVANICSIDRSGERMVS